MTITLAGQLTQARARRDQLEALLRELGAAVWDLEAKQRWGRRYDRGLLERLREDMLDAEFQLMLATTDVALLVALLEEAAARRGER